ncbi:hypothetical protein BU26DRAFT_309409 [Trematosphaeria pertusa]|uniref:Uncharacterized protein n=1 Tax=Trematosphaeria pertusa TaxID=390896 RepID=A0A6A6IEI3_9PLEO|nr:uncharacterized protein BU26DRAFT_309409 [Trematosphaeria pertusa]KAF2248984.1 hypothetical protein BU26DRAFT_309409 [Trematosphaeria pertusa]
MDDISNVTCIRALTPYNASTLNAIRVCETAANTPYCYPPNGTRLCIPSYSFYFVWPPGYYHDDSEIAIEYDLSWSWYFGVNSSLGIDSLSFTEDMFTDEAQPMPNTTTEKLMPMYLLERRRDPEATTYDVKTHEGPTLTLVKTALFAGTTSTE